MPLPTRLGLFLLVGASACVRPPVSRTALPTLDALDRARAQVIAASDDVRAAVAARDTAALRPLLVDDVELVTAARDTVRGRDAVAEYLASHGEAAMMIQRGELAPCRDGLIVQEYGAWYYGGPRAASARQYVARGSVLYDWRTGGDRAAVRRMDIADGAGENRKPTCRRADETALRRPLTFTTSVEVGPPATSRVTTPFADALEARGYGPVHFPTVALPPAVTLGLRYRFTPLLSTELAMSAGGTARIDGVDQWEARRIQGTSTPVSITQLMQVQWRNLRVGAGPSYVRHNLRTTQSRERYSVEERRWLQESPERFESSSAAGTFGVALESAITFPVRRLWLIEARMSTARYGAASTPRTPQFDTLSIGRSATSLSIGLGVGW